MERAHERHARLDPLARRRPPVADLVALPRARGASAGASRRRAGGVVHG